MDVLEYWNAVLRQDREALAVFFWEDALVRWHNTNEQFTAAEFIRVNCDYPGQWDGNVETVIPLEHQVITITHVHQRENTSSCHAVSFFHIRDGKIQYLDEYWGDDGPPPCWRQEMDIGSPIREN